MFQWVHLAGGSNQGTFPVAFSSIVYFLTVTGIRGAATDKSYQWVAWWNTTGFSSLISSEAKYILVIGI